MAKLDEGDPRWLVQDRKDGKNVNNWHWSEENMFQWAKERIISLFEGSSILDNDTHHFTVTKVDSMKGDVSINVRKGRKIFIWDFNLTLLWKGVTKATGEEGKGKIDCFDINVTDEDFEISIAIDDERPATRDLRGILKTVAYKFIQDNVKTMTGELVKNFGDLPNQDTKKTQQTEAPKLSDEKTSTKTVTSKGETLNVTTISMKLGFQVPASALYETLTDVNRVAAFSGQAADWSLTEGSDFRIFGGFIEGKQVSFVPNKKIVQNWRFKTWPENHHSVVTFDFEDKGDKCELSITQKGVPTFDLERVHQGWENNYWNRIMALFGWRYEKL